MPGSGCVACLLLQPAALLPIALQLLLLLLSCRASEQPLQMACLLSSPSLPACCAGLLAVLESDRELNGRWWAWDGKEIPW